MPDEDASVTSLNYITRPTMFLAHILSLFLALFEAQGWKEGGKVEYSDHLTCSDWELQWLIIHWASFFPISQIIPSLAGFMT